MHQRMQVKKVCPWAVLPTNQITTAHEFLSSGPQLDALPALPPLPAVPKGHTLSEEEEAAGP